MVGFFLAESEKQERLSPVCVCFFMKDLFFTARAKEVPKNPLSESQEPSNFPKGPKVKNKHNKTKNVPEGPKVKTSTIRPNVPEGKGAARSKHGSCVPK